MNNTKTPFLNDLWYNRLKWFVQLLLPAFGTFYFTLGNVWGFGYVEQVVGTVAALSTFIGTLIMINAKRYVPHSGDLVVTEGEDGQKFLYAALEDESVLESDELLMKVVRDSF